MATTRIPRTFKFKVGDEEHVVSNETAFELPKHLKLKRVGRGSNRTAYLLPDGKHVLKLGGTGSSRHSRLQGQTEKERKVWRLAVRAGLAEHFATMKAGNGEWVVQEYIPHKSSYYGKNGIDSLRRKLGGFYGVGRDLHSDNTGQRTKDGPAVVFDYGYVEV